MQKNPGRKERRKRLKDIGDLIGERKMKRDNNAQKVAARKARKARKK